MRYINWIIITIIIIITIVITIVVVVVVIILRKLFSESGFFRGIYQNELKRSVKIFDPTAALVFLLWADCSPYNCWRNGGLQRTVILPLRQRPKVMHEQSHICWRLVNQRSD